MPENTCATNFENFVEGARWAFLLHSDKEYTIRAENILHDRDEYIVAGHILVMRILNYYEVYPIFCDMSPTEQGEAVRNWKDNV